MATIETTRQSIDLRNFELDGRVLDIGGGGEGIIAQALTSKKNNFSTNIKNFLFSHPKSYDEIIAIDIRPEELEETTDIGIKILMDATDLKFLDNYFEHCTCFYSLMYMNTVDTAKAISEAFRVLEPGGTLHIWDAVIPPLNTTGLEAISSTEQTKHPNVFITHLNILLSKTEAVSTSYGVGEYETQSQNSIRELCEQAGFKYVAGETTDEKFWLEMTKESHT